MCQQEWVAKVQWKQRPPGLIQKPQSYGVKWVIHMNSKIPQSVMARYRMGQKSLSHAPNYLLNVRGDLEVSVVSVDKKGRRWQG